jgi:DNA-3-methyladenine glycosylase II
MSTAIRTATLPLVGPYDLREVALMGFGHRDESAFDGVMRLAFCTDAPRHAGRRGGAPAG